MVPQQAPEVLCVRSNEGATVSRQCIGGTTAGPAIRAFAAIT
jgi:hypothetical protein